MLGISGKTLIAVGTIAAAAGAALFFAAVGLGDVNPAVSGVAMLAIFGGIGIFVVGRLAND